MASVEGLNELTLKSIPTLPVRDLGSHGSNYNSDSTPFVNDQERGHHLWSARRRGARVWNTR